MAQHLGVLPALLWTSVWFSEPTLLYTTVSNYSWKRSIACMDTRYTCIAHINENKTPKNIKYKFKNDPDFIIFYRIKFYVLSYTYMEFKNCGHFISYIW